MRTIVFLILSLLYTVRFKAQGYLFPESLRNTMISNLKDGDSLIYYQCHVELTEQTITTAGGQTITTAPQKYSITEKIITKRNALGYTARYYVSSMIALPNRKFSGQKIRERKYWNYKFLKEESLDENDLKILGAIELKGHEPTEYDFAVTVHSPNQIIIKKGKDFRQLVGIGDNVLSNLLFNEDLLRQRR